MQKQPRLLLLPNVLNDEQPQLPSYFTEEMINIVPKLDGLIAESEKGGRYFLKRFPFPEGKSFRDIPIKVLSEHTKNEEMQELVNMVKQGGTIGLISDAGLPCLADPGARLVFLLRKADVLIEALTGPSSIIMALMLSGLGAQKFTFEGYLPKEGAELSSYLKLIQQRAMKEGSTHIFIETPYRCQQLFDKLLSDLDDRMKLSISIDLTIGSQEVYTKSIKEWKGCSKPSLNKRLCVFVLSA